MYRIESPDCPQKLVLGVSRRSFLFGICLGAVLTIGGMHFPWHKIAALRNEITSSGDLRDAPTGPIGLPSSGSFQDILRPAPQ